MRAMKNQLLNRKGLKRKSVGVTLIELLVAMVIGLFIVSGVVSVMVDSKDNFLMEQEVAFIQENARFLVDELSHEIRMAGFFGCHVPGQLTNTLFTASDSTNTTPTNWMFSSNGVRGYTSADANGLAGFSSAPTAYSDVLIINRGEPTETLRVSAHNVTNSTLTLTGTHNFVPGDILVIEDESCSNSAIFQMTGPAVGGGGGGTSDVQHRASAAPGNCHKALSDGDGEGYGCSGVPPLFENGNTYTPGSSIMRFKSSAYFIKDSAITGMPTLFRTALVESGGVATTQAQEFVSGVADMQVLYGVDTDVNVGVDVNGDGVWDSDGEVNRYFTTEDLEDEIASSAENATFWWGRVLAVRVTLILRSNVEVFPTAQTIDLGGGFESVNYPFLANTRYIYQKIVISSSIRNRGLGL